MSIKKSILLRVRLAFLAFALFGVVVLYRIFHLQVNEGEKWSKRAEDIGLKYMTVKATRGNIYADDGSLLATSLPVYNVALDPSVASDRVFREGIDSLCIHLSDFFGDRSAREYQQRITNARVSGREYMLLSRNEIDYQGKKMMIDWPIFREGRMKGGVIFEKMNKRFKPFSHLGSRTIGVLNQENNGVFGLEHSFNQALAGRDGESLFQKMSGGGWRPVYDGTEIRPKDGFDIVTTIDINLQDVAEYALLSALEEHEADYGSVVLMEVATGQIKAMSNLGRNAKGKYWERYNYAVGEQASREPGSTFKLASMMALLEKGKVNLADTVDTGNGQLKIYNEVMKDHKPGGYGKITVQEIFEKSSNIGIAKLVTREFGSNPEVFVNYIQKLGLADPLGFQMVGEGKPYIKHPKDSTWSGLTLPWMSHGYELKLTPLHTLTLYNAVANNGKMVQPMIVNKVTNANRTIESFETKVLNEKIASDKTLRDIRYLLEGVVKRGTASNIGDSYYQIAGKTGTAKKVVNGRYTNKYYTSFAGYFPAKKPKYSCIVVIDNPKGYKIYGSDVAAPVFRAIADKVYTLDLDLENNALQGPQIAGVFPVVRSGQHEELRMVLNELGISNHLQGSADWVKTSISNNSIIWKPNDYKTSKVPDVRGMTLRDAIPLLENKGLAVSVEGQGRVVKQSLVPGRTVDETKEIKLTLGS